MKNFQRESVSRRSPRTTLITGAALLALAAGFSIGTAQAADKDANCKEETKRVAVWPRGPKAAQTPTRVEERVLTICDGKVVSSRRASAEEALHATDEG